MNRLQYIVLAVLLVAVTSTAVAQRQTETDRQYQNARELFDLKKYGLAKQAFKPLTNRFEGNPYAAYASFFYALAAYHDGEEDLARNMLLQIKKNYPQWENIQEVDLWLAKLELESGQIKSAIQKSRDVAGGDARETLDALKAARVSDLPYAELLTLYEEFPDDKVLATALAASILRQPLELQDRDLLENIVSLFQLDSKKYSIDERVQSEKKAVYEVAVLLPFLYQDLAQSPSRVRNKFVIDLYQGILLGQRALKKQGIDININAYDTQQDSLTTRKLLALPEMKSMDLIIGPLYPDPVRLTAAFAYEHKVNMVNPLSHNSEITKNNSFAFLFNPTTESQGFRAAEFLAGHLNDGKKTVMIFYGDNPRDSLRAAQYRQAMIENDYRVIYHREVRTENAKRILDLLTNTVTIEEADPTLTNLSERDLKVLGNLSRQENEYLVIRPDSVGHVFLSSSDPALAANTITALEIRRDDIALVGLHDWVKDEKRVISFDALESLKTYLIAPFYPQHNTEALTAFREAYYQEYKSYPTENAMIGYELTIVMGTLMNRFGNHFQFEDGADAVIKGRLSPGFRLNKEQSNQYVPILNFHDAELRLINPK